MSATARAVRRGRGRAIARLAARRLAFAVPILLLVSFALFALAKASPFNPIERYFGVRILGASPERVAAIRANWGVDQPVLVQWWAWLRNTLSGDPGDSLSLQQPVSQVIGERFGWSLLLVSVGFAFALLLGLALGTLAAWRAGGAVDRLVTATAYVLEATLPFLLGIAALYVFALALGWLPGGGLTDAGAEVGVGQVARHLVLPAAVLAVSQAPPFVLFVRQALLESLTQDHVVGARARGLPERTVLVQHALRTSLLPFITLVGARLPELVTGALLVETVFSWPGVGRFVVESIKTQDIPSVLGSVVTLAIMFSIVNLLVDILYAFIDPRIRLAGERR